jgi:hypothetical protein
VAKLPSILKSPASQATYTKLLSAVEKLGPFEVEEKKTCIHLTRGRAFAGVHPRADGIVLSLVFDTPLENPRVRKSEQLSATAITPSSSWKIRRKSTRRWCAGSGGRTP